MAWLCAPLCLSSHSQNIVEGMVAKQMPADANHVNRASVRCVRCARCAFVAFPSRVGPTVVSRKIIVYVRLAAVIAEIGRIWQKSEIQYGAVSAVRKSLSDIRVLT